MKSLKNTRNTICQSIILAAYFFAFQSCSKTTKSAWKEVFTLPTGLSSSTGVREIQCKEGGIGYALVGNGFIRTINGGRLWTDGSNAMTSNYVMVYFDFVTEKGGLCIASDNNNTKVFGTNNGGETWILKASASTSPALAGRSGYQLIMTDSTKGIIMTSNEEFLSTADGGKTWKYEGKLTTLYNISPCISVNGSTITALEKNGKVSQSLDNGKSWLSKGTVPGGSSTSTSTIMYSIASVDGKLMFAALKYIAYKSTDAGKTWVKITPSGIGAYYSVNIYATNALSFIGHDGDGYKVTWTSFDGGNSWHQDLISMVAQPVEFDMSSDKTGLASCGNKFYRYLP